MRSLLGLISLVFLYKAQAMNTDAYIVKTIQLPSYNVPDQADTGKVEQSGESPQETQKRKPEYDELCKQKFGNSFHFSTVTTESKRGPIKYEKTNLFFDKPIRTYTMSPSLLCISVKNTTKPAANEEHPHEPPPDEDGNPAQ